MNLALHNDDEDIQVDMSPMIDMVFLLLIFFIVASAIVDEKVPVNVPTAVFAKVPDDITGRFIISVKKEGTLFVGPKEVSITELKALLRPEVELNPNLRILIRSDGNVEYKINEKVMTACAEVGANDLIYSAFEK
jgi:biopolymer transport protein ExbD